MLSLTLHHPGIAQPCNPVIDGTYCATQMPRSLPSTPTSSRPSMRPVEDIASAISVRQDMPGTFGAISFRGDGSSCIGLLRRGSCN
jgi:hypothetical protein